MADQGYMERVRAALGGQVAPPAPDGGRVVLYRCDHCGTCHLQRGAQHFYRLTAEQVAALAAELGADMATLPYATCGICALQSVGLIELDGYGHGRGLGLSWEGTPESAHAHLLASVVALEWATREMQAGRPPRAEVIADYPQARRILSWWAQLRDPRDARRLTRADAAAMAADNPPALPGAPGQWVWHGAMWVAPCTALGGSGLVNVAQALPVGHPFSLSLCLVLVRRVAELVLAGNIAGEHSGGDPLC